jgi:hypothetical protein
MMKGMLVLKWLILEILILKRLFARLLKEILVNCLFSFSISLAMLSKEILKPLSYIDSFPKRYNAIYIA